jgi:hypothetical protein
LPPIPKTSRSCSAASLYQLLPRAHLSDEALALLRRRVIDIALFAWLPLLVLAALQGQALHGSPMPFLKDFELHIRFLVALPLLIVAEYVVHARLQPTLRLLRERSVVPDFALPRLEAAVASAYALRNSLVANSCCSPSSTSLAFISSGDTSSH